MLELHPELPTPFVLLENVRHNESEIDEVKERLSDFCVSAFCTDAIWVSARQHKVIEVLASEAPQKQHETSNPHKPGQVQKAQFRL